MLANITRILILTLFSQLGFVMPIHAESPKCKNKLTGDLSAAAWEIKQVLLSVSEKFCSEQLRAGKSWKTLKITSIQRSIDAQAGYIKSCLASGCKVYENQAAVAEYQALATKNKQTIAETIRDQISRNCYISKHLSNRAVDIGTAGHSKAEVERLKQLIKATHYTVNNIKYTAWIEDRSHGTGPHLHLNFEPYGFIPDQCPKAIN
jgi:hypothetical protein